MVADVGHQLRRVEDVRPGIGLAELEESLEALRSQRPDGGPLLPGHRLEAAGMSLPRQSGLSTRISRISKATSGPRFVRGTLALGITRTLGPAAG